MRYLETANHMVARTLEAAAGDTEGESDKPLTLFRFSIAIAGFLAVPGGGRPMPPAAGLKAGMQSESARLDEVIDLLGDAKLRRAISSSNCTA